MATILVIIPYSFYPPKYGGALRCFYLMRELAFRHKVHLLTVQQEADFAGESEPFFPESVSIVSSANQPGYRTAFNLLPSRIANAVNSRILKRSFWEKGNLYLVNVYPLLKKILRNNQIDVVLYENLDCFCVLNPHVRRLSPRTIHIYDAHNIDSELWLQHYKYEGKPELKDYAAGSREVEKRLHQTLSLCLTCSDVDRRKMVKLNDGLLTVRTIPNGVDTEQRPFDNNPGKHKLTNILFCGTLDYTPNTEGLLWFHREVFPILKDSLPQLTLTVIGKMDQARPYSDLLADMSVHFIGPVECVIPYYHSSSLLVVPLRSGSGTRLKILEAMSMGNPVVSTTVGAEGIEVQNNEHIRLADEPEEFAAAILNLFQYKDNFERQRSAARNLVTEKYDWKIIGKRLNENIQEVLENSGNYEYAELDKT